MGRRLGQHFLSSSRTAERIIEESHLTKNDIILEIGPGKGILTGHILPKVKELIAVELDEKLVRFLKRQFGNYRNLTLINEDFLKLKGIPGKKVKFVANLPYYITSPILQRIISWPNWDEAIITIQKEVAKRIISSEGSRDYSVLTISVQVKAKAEILFVIPRQDFFPMPKVDSAVVRLKPLEEPLIGAADEAKFFKFIHACFQQRRKTIVNSMSHNLDMAKSVIIEGLRQLDLDPRIRAEDIELNTYIRLYKILF